jgi:hypothetical protein
MIEEEEDNDDLNVIDPELISYSTTTRGGEQMIYLNKVYQIKKFKHYMVIFVYNGIVKIDLIAQLE